MGFPFKPGDWVSDGVDRIARVKSVWTDKPGVVLLDLVMFDHSGDRLGRTSPAMGGPKSFEPACSSDGWRRVAAPEFPMTVKWVTEGGKRQLGPPPFQKTERWQQAYAIFRGGFRKAAPPHWDDLEPWVRDAIQVSYLQGKLDH